MEKRIAKEGMADYLNRERTTGLKGLLALGVLLSHMIPASNLFSNRIIIAMFSSLGYLSVSVFFFMSGYGIMAQYQKNQEKYLGSFLKNRVLSIYLLSVFLIVLYSVFHAVIGQGDSVFEIFQSFLIGRTIINNGWYLQIVLLFYILWFICTKYIKNPQKQFLVLCVLIACYMVVGVLTLSKTWYECSICFLIGIFWQKNREKIDIWMETNKRERLLLFVAAAIVFTATYMLSFKTLIPSNKVLDSLLHVVTAVISSSLFVVLTLMINIFFAKARFLESNTLRFIGERSMEIYVLQGIPLVLFAETVFNIGNSFLYILAVAVVTALLSIILHPLIRYITNIPKKYLQ